VGRVYADRDRYRERAEKQHDLLMRLGTRLRHATAAGITQWPEYQELMEYIT